MFLLFFITVHFNARIPKNFASWTLSYKAFQQRYTVVFVYYGSTLKSSFILVLKMGDFVYVANIE